MSNIVKTKDELVEATGCNVESSLTQSGFEKTMKHAEHLLKVLSRMGYTIESINLGAPWSIHIKINLPNQPPQALFDKS